MLTWLLRRKKETKIEGSRPKPAKADISWKDALLNRLTETSPHGFLAVNYQTDEILLFNSQFCELWGITHLEAAMRHGRLKYWEIISSCLPEVKHAKAFTDSLQLLQAEDNRKDYEDKIPMADGRVIRMFSTQIRDTGDQYLGRIYIFEDITQPKTSKKLVTIQRDLATKLSATTSLQEALSLTLESISLIEQIDVCGIYLFDTNEGDLTLTVHMGMSDNFIREKSTFDAGSQQVKQVLSGKPLNGPYRPDLFADMGKDHENLQGIALIPIIYEGKVMGTFLLCSGKLARFSQNIQASFESLALQIGGTISRIKAENALHSSQENFRMLFDTISDFMFVLDLDGIILRTNTMMETRLGYSSDEFKQLHVLEIYPPERRDEVGLILDEMLKGKSSSCPVPLLAKDGSQIPAETHVIMGKWDGNNVLFGISRDVTERQKAEEALRESEARWNFALEVSGDGVWDWNLLTGEVFYSRAWKAMLGYNEAEIGNMLDEWTKRIHPEDHAIPYADLNLFLGGEPEIYSNEHRLLCKDGTYKWILDRGKVVAWQQDGKPLRAIGTHSDVSKRKEFEESLRSAIAKEKELSDLKSRFVSMASHEFRTPLSTILMMEDSLMSYWKRMDEQQIAAKLQNIKDQVLHLTKVVTDVMMVAKIQEGQLSYEAESIDLVALIKGVIEGFNADQLLRDKIIFATDFVDLFMDLDSRIIVQVLNNLISNALKYAQPDPVVKVKLYQQSNEILISIHDNGIGIPETDQKNLFRPFFRAQNVKQIQGDGLGLNIVRESILLHGGNITFDSKLGEGSNFVVHLPKKLVINSII